MLWVPQKGVLRREHNLGSVGGSPLGTAVTTGASASTKGTPAQLIASTSFEAYWVRVMATTYGNTTATASEGSMDILIGAATEDILIPDLLMGYCGGDTATQCGPKVWDFPLYVPAGSRLSAQAAGARVSTAVRVQIFLYGGHGYPPFRVGSKVTTYGIGTVPNGVTITPGASGAEGTFTQITASTSQEHFAFVPSFQVSTDTTTNNRVIAVDLGIGAATEEEIADQWIYRTDVNEAMEGPWNAMPCFQDVPSGTRLAMRASNNNTNDGPYNGAIHAVT